VILAIKKDANNSSLYDQNVIKNRFDHEGVPFLYKTLPDFCAYVLSCTETGRLERQSWFKTNRHSVIPRFLRVHTSKIFYKDGTLRPSSKTSSEGIAELLQICDSFKKLKGFADEELLAQQCEEGFINLEEELDERQLYENGLFQLHSAKRVLDEIFSQAPRRESKYFYMDLLNRGISYPANGPGATRPSTLPHERFEPSEIAPYTSAIDQIDLFSVNAHFYSNVYQNSYGSNGIGAMGFPDVLGLSKPIQENPEFENYFTTVEKSSLKRRPIAIENRLLTTIGKIISGWVTPFLENQTDFHINFENQSVNAELCKDLSMSTLDISAASDRILNSLVEVLFRDTPLSEDLKLLRSKTTVLDKTRKVKLKKYATMGNVLTFPIESVIFYSISVAAVAQKYLRLPMWQCTTANLDHAINWARKEVYTYGDDIVVPTRDFNITVDFLSRLGFPISEGKSFSRGPFRESCGAYAYAGYMFDLTKVRTVPIKRKGKTIINKGLVSYIASMHLFAKQGFWNTVRVMRAYISDLDLPIGCAGSPILCYPLQDQSYEGLVKENCLKTSWCPNLQQPIIKGYSVVTSVIRYPDAKSVWDYIPDTTEHYSDDGSFTPRSYAWENQRTCVAAERLNDIAIRKHKKRGVNIPTQEACLTSYFWNLTDQCPFGTQEHSPLALQQSDSIKEIDVPLYLLLCNGEDQPNGSVRPFRSGQAG
jgi:hypothetical protein